MSMKRRTYLTAIGAASTTLLSGCTSSQSTLGSTNDTTETSTPDTPIKSISYKGESLIVSLRPSSTPRLVELLKPNGEVTQQQKVNTATQVSFHLTNANYARESCEGILDPGKYTITVGTQSGDTYRHPVTLKPNITISGITVPARLGPRDEYPENDLYYYGSLVIQFKNSGTLPGCVNNTAVMGREIPSPHPLVVKTTVPISGEVKIDDGPSARLNKYPLESDTAMLANKRAAVGVGKSQYQTLYIPFKVPRPPDTYRTPSESENFVKRVYGGKIGSGIVIANMGKSGKVGLPFRFLLSGDTRYVGSYSGDNGTVFTDTRLAYDSQGVFDASNISGISDVASVLDNTTVDDNFLLNTTNSTSSSSS